MNAPWLLAPLAIEALTSFFGKVERPILKRRPLQLLSAQPANILPHDDRLPAWLQRRLILNFETRIIKRHEEVAAVVLACGVGTRNIIDVSCKILLETGFPLKGRYVSSRISSDDNRIGDFFRLCGRVVDIQGSLLILEDYGDGKASVESDDVFLEPRRETFSACVAHLLGVDAGREALSYAENTASRILSGPERLTLIKRTFDYIRKQPIELAPGAPLELGEVAGTTRQSWIYRNAIIQKRFSFSIPAGPKPIAGTSAGSINMGLTISGPSHRSSFASRSFAKRCMKDRSTVL